MEQKQPTGKGISPIDKWKILGWYFSIALVAEVAASWWTWARAPTDSLRVLYQGNFWGYEMERLIPWLVGFALLAIARQIGIRSATQI